MKDHSFESPFDKWKKEEVERLERIARNAAQRAGWMTDAQAIKEYERLTGIGQGKNRQEPLQGKNRHDPLDEEEQALREALAKKINIRLDE